jgi:sterol desaturase/sphingolipid hydroxylase (fatty acid hydroxylase superfamily)
MTGFTHWNTRLPLDWLAPLVVTPRYHAWHHAVEPASQRRNLAGKLTVLDALFGTRLRAPSTRPARLGLGDDDPAIPDGWIAQQLSPLRSPRTDSRPS